MKKLNPFKFVDNLGDMTDFMVISMLMSFAMLILPGLYPHDFNTVTETIKSQEKPPHVPASYDEETHPCWPESSASADEQ